MPPDPNATNATTPQCHYQCHYDHKLQTRHSRAGGNPRHVRDSTVPWIPACAGMTCGIGV
ncbi:hypothetical protein F2P46_25100 [Massilia sp. CCM 8734]|nr:hypothetical protein [Massilia sp. CCM 8734]